MARSMRPRFPWAAGGFSSRRGARRWPLSGVAQHSPGGTRAAAEGIGPRLPSAFDRIRLQRSPIRGAAGHHEQHRPEERQDQEDLPDDVTRLGPTTAGTGTDSFRQSWALLADGRNASGTSPVSLAEGPTAGQNGAAPVWSARGLVAAIRRKHTDLHLGTDVAQRPGEERAGRHRRRPTPRDRPVGPPTVSQQGFRTVE
jgi:hypothetical protein